MNGLDSIEDSINRASGIHCRADHQYALYFSSGRIASVARNSPHFDYRVGKKSCNHVVGIYNVNVDFRLIVDDIKFFYAEAIKNQEAPSFTKVRKQKNAQKQSETQQEAPAY